MGYRVAVVGATGNVGREMLNILSERLFPADEVVALASGRSNGREVSFGDGVLKVQDLAKYNFSNIRVYIYDVSRFMRDVLIATKFISEVFEPNNCDIHSIIDKRVWNKDNNNKLDFLRELIESEAYSVLLSNKMKINSKNRKQMGNHIGGITFGYERYKNNSNLMKLRKNNSEQKILGYIKKND